MLASISSKHNVQHNDDEYSLSDSLLQAPSPERLDHSRIVRSSVGITLAVTETQVPDVAPPRTTKPNRLVVPSTYPASVEDDTVPANHFYDAAPHHDAGQNIDKGCKGHSIWIYSLIEV